MEEKEGKIEEEKEIMEKYEKRKKTKISLK